jgi:hypothetical protein
LRARGTARKTFGYLVVNKHIATVVHSTEQELPEQIVLRLRDHSAKGIHQLKAEASRKHVTHTFGGHLQKCEILE